MIMIIKLLILLINGIYSFQQNRTSIFGTGIYSSIQIDPLDIPWIDLDAASCSIPGSPATCNTLSQTFSDIFEAKNFNFSIPEIENITIQSIFVTWYVSVQTQITPRIHEIQISLFKDGGGLTGIKYNTSIISYTLSQGWSTTVETITYPKLGETDLLWGIQWNSFEINSQNFGVSLRLENPSGMNINCYVYCIEISVIYDYIIQTISTSEFESEPIIRKNEYNIIAISILILFIMIAFLLVYIIYKNKNKNKKKLNQSESTTVLTMKNFLDDNSIYIESENMTMKRIIGSGTFGSVYLYKMNETTDVVCKILKKQGSDQEFENEVRILMSLRNPYIVMCYGIYQNIDTNTNIEHKYIVMEYLPEGSLDKFLKKEDNRKKMKILDLISLCITTAAGMHYLEKKNIIHRDLSARNLLVFKQQENQKFIVKITDFGMGKQLIEQDLSIYKEKEESLFAIKWAAPEVIKSRIYSIKSDVWSFGIVLWEIFSWCEIPYNLSNKDTMLFVLSDNRLTKPIMCPRSIYDIMINSCWCKSPDKRSSFQDIYNSLKKIEKSHNIVVVNNDELICESSHINVDKFVNQKGGDSDSDSDEDEDEYEYGSDQDFSEEEENVYLNEISVSVRTKKSALPRYSFTHRTILNKQQDQDKKSINNNEIEPLKDIRTITSGPRHTPKQSEKTNIKKKKERKTLYKKIDRSESPKTKRKKL